MQTIMVPKFPQLKGKDAIVALNNFINELESKEKELSENQTLTLRKVAKFMISYIEEEESRKPRKESGFAKFKASIMRRSKKAETLA
jgi:hypothetical protein